MIARSGWSAAAVLTLVLGIVVAGALVPRAFTSAQTASGQQTQVMLRTSVCPQVRSPGDGSETTTTFVTPEGQGTGTIHDSTRESADPLPAPGTAVRTVPQQPGATVVVTAEGGAAAATSTVREYFDPADEGRGAAVASCDQPAATWWFVGVSAEPGQLDELLLANPTPSPAVVTVDVYGPQGTIDVLGVGGVVVQPGESSVIRVDSLIPGVGTSTLRVTTSGGLVSAALRSTSVQGLIPRGAEFIPAAAQPARNVVVPGVLPGSGPRQLVITAPAEDAAAGIGFLGPDGQIQASAGQVPLPAGHTVTVDLAPDLAGAAAAVAVSATADVTAAVRSTLEAAAPPEATGLLSKALLADVAWTAAQLPITQDWWLPVSGAAGMQPHVLLTAQDAAISVSITTTAASGATAQQSINIPPDSTVDVPVPAAADSASLLLIERAPGDGLLYAASVMWGAAADGPFAAAATGSDPAATVTLPPAYPDANALSNGS